MNKKTGYLDGLRLLAMLTVVLIHTVSGVLTGYIDSPMMGTGQLYFYNSLKDLCTIGVPIFLMISGTLFLNPEKIITIKSLLGKYLRRLVLALLFFGTGYALLEIVFNSRSFEFRFLWMAFKEMLLGNSWGHMWYLYMLIFIYLFIPVFKAFVNAASKQTYFYVLTVLFIICAVIPFIRENLGFYLFLSIPAVQISEFGIYIFYFLAGYYIHQYFFEKDTIKKPLYIVTILLGVSLAVLIFANQYMNLGIYVSYNSVITVMLSLIIFAYAKLVFGECRLSGKIRENIFGVYLIHTFFINLLYKVCNITPLMLGGYVLLPVFVIGVFLVTLMTVWVLRRIPPLRKYIL